MYCDGRLRAAGFTGEWVHSGAVLAVKTHQRHPDWTEPDKPVLPLENEVCRSHQLTLPV